jgi:hypothetical protein
MPPLPHMEPPSNSPVPVLLYEKQNLPLSIEKSIVLKYIISGFYIWNILFHNKDNRQKS